MNFQALFSQKKKKKKNRMFVADATSFLRVKDGQTDRGALF